LNNPAGICKKAVDIGTGAVLWPTGWRGHDRYAG
jgi:hypothetical protein